MIRFNNKRIRFPILTAAYAYGFFFYIIENIPLIITGSHLYIDLYSYYLNKYVWYNVAIKFSTKAHNYYTLSLNKVGTNWSGEVFFFFFFTTTALICVPVRLAPLSISLTYNKNLMEGFYFCNKETTRILVYSITF